MATGRSVRVLLYGVKPTDPSTLGFAVVYMTVVALTATFLPTRSVVSVQPIETLREE